MASHATHTLLGIQFQPFWYRTSQLSPKIRHNTGSIKLDMHININIQITENFYGLVLELTLCIQILVISEIQLINQVHLSQPKGFYEWAANLWKKKFDFGISVISFVPFHWLDIFPHIDSIPYSSSSSLSSSSSPANAQNKIVHARKLQLYTTVSKLGNISNCLVQSSISFPLTLYIYFSN